MRRGERSEELARHARSPVTRQLARDRIKIDRLVLNGDYHEGRGGGPVEADADRGERLALRELEVADDETERRAVRAARDAQEEHSRVRLDDSVVTQDEVDGLAANALALAQRARQIGHGGVEAR